MKILNSITYPNFILSNNKNYKENVKYNKYKISLN